MKSIKEGERNVSSSLRRLQMKTIKIFVSYSTLSGLVIPLAIHLLFPISSGLTLVRVMTPEFSE